MDNFMFGIMTGSILLLGAVGWSLIKKVEGYMDMGYGQYLMLGAYLGWHFATNGKIPILIAALMAVTITSILALAIAKIFYHPIRSYGSTMILFTSVGIAYIIHGTVEIIWGVNAKTFDMGAMPTIYKIGDMQLLSSTEVGIIIVAWITALGVHLILTKTKIGKAIRAMASNYELAQARGIDTVRMSSYVHLIAGFLGGLAGVLIGMHGSIYVDMGWVQVLIILSAVILGGLNASVYGVMAAAMVVGIGMEMSVYILKSAYRPAVAFGLVVIVLFIKPEGLFTRQTRKIKEEKIPAVTANPENVASKGGAQ